MQTIPLHEAQSHLAEIIKNLDPGQEITITRDDKPVATIRAVVAQSTNKPTPKFGSARGKITMSEDFDAPLEDFREYME